MRQTDKAPLKRAELMVIVVAALANVLVARILPRGVYVPANLLLALSAIAVARHAGLTANDLGLDRAKLSYGLRLGLLGALIVGCIVALGMLTPARTLFADPRALAPQGASVLYESLVRIPLGTALAEEVLFRGVLLGLALRWSSPSRAITRNAVLFGLWHILPAIASLATPAANGAPHTPLGSALVILTTIVVTGVGGICFAYFRLRSGSVMAPVLIHATLNVAAFWAARLV